MVTPTGIGTTELRLPAAQLGPESPLPAFAGLQRLPDVSASPGLPPEMRERIAYGRLASPLPYALHDGYSRERRERAVPAITLSNDRLEAVVLPQYGGRLWSLRHLASGRDLVYRNPVLTFANFGLTGAWFAGGVEWNLGSTGHSATSSRPVFAAAVGSDDGPVLRLWEWERTRDLVFQVDLSLPRGSEFLYASVRVRNPDGHDKPLYWWTNIAVPESPEVRVLAPASSAWRTDYAAGISRVPVPHPVDTDVDVSYSMRAPHAADYFFELEPKRRRWITSLDADGRGLVQTSTATLTGRKLFLWGTGAGGGRWQEWLSGPGSRYQEIQAGLATTQLEHLRLGAGSELSWTEAFGPITVPPERAHGDWAPAGHAVEEALDVLLPADVLDDRHRRWLSDAADRSPGELLHRGSGFGLAELAVRGRDGDALPGTPFLQPAPDNARHLLALLRDGLDVEQAGRELVIPPVSPVWDPVFAAAPASWWTSLMRAIRAHATGDTRAAHQGYQESLDARRSAWALRGLAVLAGDDEQLDRAADLLLAAVALEPDCRPLLVETTEALLRAGRAGDCLRVIDGAPAATADSGRLVLQRVRALVAESRLGEAAGLLEAGFEVADLREGDSLGALWHTVFRDRRLPARYDFAMAPVEG